MPSGNIAPAEFVSKWSKVKLPERAASQEHFIDLCRLLGQPTPAEHDATGAEYTFEKGVEVTGPASRRAQGKYGFADVWWKDKFGWEYKTKDKYKDLDEAYRQLLQYREALGNPPLLVVCDISRIIIHTNFTSTTKQKIEVPLARLAERENIALLQRVFTDPLGFKPKLTLEQITKDVAVEIGKLARSIESRNHDPQDVAHFLMKCMFCLFAEDVGLLPENLFNNTVRAWQDDPPGLTPVLTDLFAKMRDGGAFGPVKVEHFNGGLYDDKPAIELNKAEIGTLLIASGRDWSEVEPSIFGTLFERSLDPAKRSQIGAHYTSRDDILLIVEPVVMRPLRDRWEKVRSTCEDLLAKRTAATARRAKGAHKKGERTPRWYDNQIADALRELMDELAELRILDPACGSGNFLYVAIQQLLELEKEIYTYASQPHIAVNIFPNIRPTQLHGIEINPFAAELAKVVIWIGYLQWMRDNGFVESRRPILDPLDTIECRDAILDLSDAEHPAPAGWPQADFIIGNPPFLGSKLFRDSGLHDDYVKAMYGAYEIPNSSDLCCYWFERARMVIDEQPSRARSSTSRAARAGDGRARAPRVGLLATQGIRGGTNRKTLERIKQAGDIFMAWADRKWVLDGAAVQVSMVGFDDGSETARDFDGAPVDQINSDLTAGVDASSAKRLDENDDIAFQGDTKVGPFDIKQDQARVMLAAPNPNGRSNLEVVRPWANGLDVTRRPRAVWIIDFPPGMGEEDASRYESPFQHAAEHVRPMRKKARSGDATGVPWWIHQRPRPDMRGRIESLGRFVATPNLTKHRLFVFMANPTLPDHQLIAFARSDDYFFGVLHSSVHELWARRMGTQLREAESGFRYTPTTCFETFALPWAPGDEPISRGREPAERELRLAADLHQRISEAARELNEQRERWLDPPEWIEPIAQTVDRFDDFADVPEEARPLVRESAIMAMAAKDARLKKRTLTNLYNQRPEWLKHAHEKLDRAVLAAYAATDPDGGWDEDWAEVWVETGAGQPLPDGHALTERRAEVEQRVLAALLELNHRRSRG